MIDVPRVLRKRASFMLLLGIVPLALAILACGEAANNGSLTTGATGANTPTTQHFKTGDQVKVGDTFVVTVNSVKASTGSAYDKPTSGNTFLIVDLTLKNVSKGEQNVSSALSFAFKDSSGQTYDETFVTNAKPPDGKIEAGGLLRGQLAYEVPKTQHDFTLAFQADIVSGGQTIWDLHM